jgi:hypothetical protein
MTLDPGPMKGYIDIESRGGGPTFNAISKPNYRHVIRWVPSPTCPPGFLVQKVERDIKWHKGSISNDAWAWADQSSFSVAYWELWEILPCGKNTLSPSFMARIPDADIDSDDFLSQLPSIHAQSIGQTQQILKLCVFPGNISRDDLGSPRFATSWGTMGLDALKLDTHKRPPKRAQDIEFPGQIEAHDMFEESRPIPRPVKGTFKIKGTVFLLPYDQLAATQWTDAFLGNRNTQRNKSYTSQICTSTYTGGPLWMSDAGLTGIRPPATASES